LAFLEINKFNQQVEHDQMADALEKLSQHALWNSSVYVSHNHIHVSHVDFIPRCLNKILGNFEMVKKAYIG
jgi:hypothetical protein